MTTKPFVLCALALLTLTGLAAVRSAPTAKPPLLSVADKAHVLGDTFTIVKTIKQMPAAVQKALGLPAKESLDGMVDAGKPFEESDMVSGKLPDRRLVLAAVNANYCLVYFESGGYGYRQQISLYRLKGGQAVSIWSADLNAPKGLLTFAQLQAAIKDGKY